MDSPGAAVIPAVFDLLATAYQEFGVKPTLLERDFNFPPMAELLGELTHIRDMQRDYASQQPQLAQADVA